jgi:hypothetical protein
LPYIINTDASIRAITGALMRTDRDGETHVVSTASRVLTSTGRRYTVAEQELLAIAFSLEKFRLYVFGHEIQLNTDNTALSFLNKCALTSKRVARWVMQMQEHNLHVKHISGANNCFADTLSRHPGGLNECEIRELSKSKGVMVAAVNLDIDPSVKRYLKDLSNYQAGHKKIQGLVQAVKRNGVNPGEKFLVKDDVLFIKDGLNYPYWRPILPAKLEIPIITFVHTSLGHLGTEKCSLQLANTFYVKSLGRKVRKFISQCDIFQKVEHPDRSYATENLSHLPSKPGELCAVDFYGPLPIGRSGVRFTLCGWMFFRNS